MTTPYANFAIFTRGEEQAPTQKKYWAARLQAERRGCRA
jgi:hypothetical protein